MIINLYLNRAENNRVDKTSYLQLVRSMEGALRDSSSLLNPVITFELPSMSDASLIDEDDEEIETPDSDIVIAGSTVFEFNYVYIPEFNRYYFVNDIVIQRTKIYIVSLSVDVLMSYKDALFALDGYIERNEYNSDVSLPDENMPLSALKAVEEIIPDRGDLVNTVFSTELSNTDENIIINVVTNYVGSYETINPPTNSGLPKINDYNFISSGTAYAINTTKLIKLMAGLMDENSTFASYVKSVVAFPFVPVNTNVNGIIYFGNYGEVSRTIEDPDTEQPIEGKYAEAFSQYIVVADFFPPSPASRTDYEPFSQYELFVPFYGWIKLPYNSLIGHRILIYYAYNKDDGSATAFVWDWSDERLIFSTPCQLGIKLPISATNAEEITTQKNALLLNLGIGLLSSGVTTGFGISTGNPFMSAKGVVGATGAITSFINQWSMLFERASSTFGDSATGLYVPPQVKLRKTSVVSNITNETEYAHLFGLPTRKIFRLSNLSGFTIVSSIHLENMSASKREKDEIERLLKSGVIL